MRAWEVNMLLSYRVTNIDRDNFEVQGSIECCDETQIILQAGLDFSSNSNQKYQVQFLTNEKKIAVSQDNEREWCITGSINKVEFRYHLNLIECKEKSLLPRINSNQLDVFWGRSIFLRVINHQTEYKISFARLTYGSCQFNKGFFYCSNGIELFLSLFFQGDISQKMLSVDNITATLICENIHRDLYGYLLKQIPRIVSTTAAFFGTSCFENLLCYITKSDDNTDIHQIGSGFSVYQGIVLMLPPKPETADNKETAWLFQHELIHQWLGISCRAGEPGLDWFFEGFTCYITLRLLQINDIIDDQYIRMITDINYQSYQGVIDKLQKQLLLVTNDQNNYMLHGGFFLAAAWDWHLWTNYQLRLDEIMPMFFREVQKKAVDLQVLLQSLASVSPSGCLPEFFDQYLKKKCSLPITYLWSK